MLATRMPRWFGALLDCQADPISGFQGFRPLGFGVSGFMGPYRGWPFSGFRLFGFQGWGFRAFGFGVSAEGFVNGLGGFRV